VPDTQLLPPDPVPSPSTADPLCPSKTPTTTLAPLLQNHKKVNKKKKKVSTPT
jgi:hypothetical protein